MRVSSRICAAIAVVLTLAVVVQRVAGDQVIGFVDHSGFFGDEDMYVDGYYSGRVGDYIPLELGRRDVRFAWKHSYWMRVVLIVSEDTVEIEEAHAIRDECAIHDDDWSDVVREWGAGISRGYVGDTILFDVVFLPPEMESRSPAAREPCVSGHYGIGISNYTRKAATIRVSSDPTGAQIAVHSLGSVAHMAFRTNNTLVAWHDSRRMIRIVLELEDHSNCVIDIETKGRGDFDEAVHCDMQYENRSRLSAL